MFNIILFEPEIAANSGNIIRLSANSGCNLHLIEPLGFSMDDRNLKRSGLDYHEYVNIKRYSSWQNFIDLNNPDLNRIFALTKFAQKSFFKEKFQQNDYFLFGCETSGLPKNLTKTFKAQNLLRLPMLENQRCLNLANSVAVVIFEAWRQNNFLNSI